MNKVYIITAGSYSDYHIVAVFLEKVKAEQFQDIHNSRICYSSQECRIEEYSICVDMSLAGKQLYCVCVNSLGSIYAYDTCEATLNRADEIGIVKEEQGFLECFIAVPMDEDEPEEYARKVASDLFAEYKARKEGII